MILRETTTIHLRPKSGC